MGNSDRFQKILIGSIMASSLCLSSVTGFAQSAHPPQEYPQSPESLPDNSPGCSQPTMAAMNNAGNYAQTQIYNAQKALIRQPTTFFGCLQGLLNGAQSLLNMFNGTGSGGIGSFLNTMAQMAVQALMQQLSQKVCSIVNNATSGLPMIGSLSAIAGGNGPVPGISVTSLLGTPANSVVPMKAGYRLVVGPNAPASAPPSASLPSGPDTNADLNWAMQTGGLSIGAAAETRPRQGVPANGSSNQISVPDGPTIPALTAPPPAVPLQNIPQGTPDAAGAYTPAAIYNADTDPYMGTGTSSMGANGPTQAAVKYKTGSGTKVCVRASCGGACGTIPWRDFNPGDLTGNESYNGGIGMAGRFAIYPNTSFGTRAQYQWLLFHNTYYGANQTISGAISHLAPPNENNTAQYTSQVVAAIPGATPNTKIGSLNQAGLTALVNKIQSLEGSRANSNVVCKPYP